MALTLVGNSITWLVKECHMCVLMVMGEAVGADVVLVVNCGFGAVAGEEKSHRMRKKKKIDLNHTTHLVPLVHRVDAKAISIERNHYSLNHFFKQLFIH